VTRFTLRLARAHVSRTTDHMARPVSLEDLSAMAC
jgi:hypothetical protein